MIAIVERHEAARLKAALRAKQARQASTVREATTRAEAERHALAARHAKELALKESGACELPASYGSGSSPQSNAGG